MNNKIKYSRNYGIMAAIASGLFTLMAYNMFRWWVFPLGAIISSLVFARYFWHLLIEKSELLSYGMAVICAILSTFSIKIFTATLYYIFSFSSALHNFNLLVSVIMGMGMVTIPTAIFLSLAFMFFRKNLLDNSKKDSTKIIHIPPR